MKQQQDYIRDISEIRSMMERSTKFLSLSGWAGIMAGVYALIGAYIADRILLFRPDVGYSPSGNYTGNVSHLILLAAVVLIFTFTTALFLSQKKASKHNEKLWNPTSRRLLANMAVPLVTGGLFVLILLEKGLLGLIAPITMLFYGLSLFIASKFTFDDIKILGFVQIILGLISAYFIGYGLLFWAIGFGVGHIVYGIYVHFKYER